MIFFQGGDDKDNVTVEDGSTTTVNIDGRVNGRQYFVTMVALSQHLPSTVTSPEMVMLCKYTCSIFFNYFPQVTIASNH